MNKVVLLYIFLIGSSLQALQYEQEQSDTLTILISVMEASMNGTFRMSNDKWGQYKNYCTGEPEVITSQELKRLWHHVESRINIIPSVTLEDKLALLHAPGCCYQVPKVIHSELSQEEIFKLQVKRMKSLIRGWGPIKNRKIFIASIDCYKKQHSERYRILFNQKTPEDVADLLIQWHHVVTDTIDVERKNYHNAINKRMNKIAGFEIKSLAQELSEIMEEKQKKERANLACYSLLANW